MKKKKKKKRVCLPYVILKNPLFYSNCQDSSPLTAGAAEQVRGLFFNGWSTGSWERHGRDISSKNIIYYIYHPVILYITDGQYLCHMFLGF
jgi:hypothetical protein